MLLNDAESFRRRRRRRRRLVLIFVRQKSKEAKNKNNILSRKINWPFSFANFFPCILFYFKNVSNSSLVSVFHPSRLFFNLAPRSATDSKEGEKIKK